MQPSELRVGSYAQYGGQLVYIIAVHIDGYVEIEYSDGSTKSANSYELSPAGDITNFKKTDNP